MRTNERRRWGGTLWTLHKNGKTVKCLSFTDSRALRYELQLVSGAETFSQECQTVHEAAATQLWWKEAMIERGWKSHDAD